VNCKAAFSQHARNESIFLQGNLTGKNLQDNQCRLGAMAKHHNAREPRRQMLLVVWSEKNYRSHAFEGDSWRFNEL